MGVLGGRQHDANEEIVEKLLYEKYNSYYRMAMSYVHNEADAMDIVQEAFAGTWLYRIMLNETYRFLGQNQAVVAEDAADQLSYEDRYENIDLKRALDNMPAKDKAVIELKYFEGLKLHEIADILGENSNTVKSRLYRGLGKLRIQLKDEDE